MELEEIKMKQWFYYTDKGSYNDIHCAYTIDTSREHVLLNDLQCTLIAEILHECPIYTRIYYDVTSNGSGYVAILLEDEIFYITDTSIVLSDRANQPQSSSSVKVGLLNRQEDTIKNLFKISKLKLKIKSTTNYKELVKLVEILENDERNNKNVPD